MSGKTATSQTPAPASLRWDEQGLPLSDTFDDYYFSKVSGLEETRYIYLQHNFLSQRWQDLAPQQDFVIGETGFGTGLSFLCCWQLWQQTAPTNARLHFISVEKHPLRPEDLRRALALWPELKAEADALLQQYPAVLHGGFHHLVFAQGRIRLTLVIDEACRGLEQLLQSSHPAHRRPQRGIDAWFLDGFAPAKNPDMWRPELFALVQQLSSANATMATFTAAGQVRRNLAQHGFSVRTSKGFGKKREMVYGQLNTAYIAPASDDFPCNGFNSSHPVPWNIKRSTDSAGEQLQADLHTAPRHAVIVGGGIAGCHTANALALRGWTVTLLEQHPQLAQEGSGNPQGVLYAKLSHRAETLSDFNLQALLFAQRAYRSYWSSATAQAGAQCGVLQLLDPEHTAQLQQCYGQQALFTVVDATEASLLSGVEVTSGGLFFPQAGWLNPGELCQQLVAHPNINVMLNCRLDELAFDEQEQQWQLHGSLLDPQTGVVQRAVSQRTPTVVLTTASHARKLSLNNGESLTAELPLKPIRGQVSYVTASAASRALKTVICGDGYLPPAVEGRHCLGATFDPHQLDLALTERDHQRNLHTMVTQVPSLAHTFVQENIRGGRAALRCTTPDYLPLVGPLPKYTELLEDYALLRKNARANIPHPGRYWQGLYVNLGHGSRGLTYTPICAELLAAQLHGEPTPVGQSLQTALHPGRFWIRDLVRKKR